MATTSTITTSLTLSGTGTTSQTININNTTGVLISNPTIESGAVAVGTGWSKVEDSDAAGGYIYIKNTTTVGNATVEVRYGTQSLGTLRPLEWAFLPVPASTSFEIKASVATTAEYAYWTKV